MCFVCTCFAFTTNIFLFKKEKSFEFNPSILSITTSKSVSTSLVGFHIHLFCHATKVVYDQLLGHATYVFSKQQMI